MAIWPGKEIVWNDASRGLVPGQVLGGGFFWDPVGEVYLPVGVDLFQVFGDGTVQAQGVTECDRKVPIVARGGTFAELKTSVAAVSEGDWAGAALARYRRDWLARTIADDVSYARGIGAECGETPTNAEAAYYSADRHCPQGYVCSAGECVPE